MKWLILLSLLFLLNNGNNHIKTVVKQSINQAVTSSFVLIGELKVVCNKNFEDYFIILLKHNAVLEFYDEVNAYFSYYLNNQENGMYSNSIYIKIEMKKLIFLEELNYNILIGDQDEENQYYDSSSNFNITDNF